MSPDAGRSRRRVEPAAHPIHVGRGVERAPPMTADRDGETRATIRAARPADAATLTGIAVAAKAHWGYPDSWLERWRPALTVVPADVARWTVRVAVDAAGTALGFAATAAARPRFVMEHLWVHPRAIGRGVGRLLLRDALRQAHDAGAVGLTIDADPHADAFYRRCGARPAGVVPAPMPGAPDRVLPRFRLDADVADRGTAADGSEVEGRPSGAS